MSAAEKAFKECEAKIKGLTKQAYKLRSEFILNFSSGKTKVKEIMNFTMIRLIRYGGEDLDKLLALLEIDPPSSEEEQSWMEKEEHKKSLIIQKYLRQPEYTMLVIAWASIDKNEKYYEAQSWNNVVRHEPNSTLDAIYDGLIALGYEMSEEEKAIKDGTHELFRKKYIENLKG